LNILHAFSGAAAKAARNTKGKVHYWALIMSNMLHKMLDESILLELNVAKLYRLFNELFPEHAVFWWKIHLEEKNHAALIRSIKEHFEPVGKVPTDLLSSSIEKLQDSNATITSLINRYVDVTPSVKEAFNAALKLELTAGEIHYQNFMNKNQGSVLNRIFQKLNNEDKNHAARLCAYMREHAIAIDEDLKDCCK